MKVLLAVPPRPTHQVLQVQPPLGLGYLARALASAGHEPVVLDLVKERRLGLAGFRRRLADVRPDIIGLSLFTPDLPAGRQLAAEAAAAQPGVAIVAGGPHPSADPIGTLAAIPELSFAFKGEAEIGLPRLASLIESAGGAAGAGAANDSFLTIPGLAWRTGAAENGGARVNAPAFVEDLDSLGSPLWRVIPPEGYQKYPPTLFVRRRPFAPIIATRGCTQRCTFCASHEIAGRGMRARSPENVVAEIETLAQDHGIREVHLEDDNFTWSEPYVLGFCEIVARRLPGLAWTLPNGVRLATLTRPMLASMKEAGCYLLIVGIESGSERVLADMKKGLTLAAIEEKVGWAREAGILVHGFFLLGYPTEKPEDREATRSLSLRLGLIGANYHTYHPLPGSEAGEALLAKGEIAGWNTDPNRASLGRPVYPRDKAGRAALKAAQRRMLLSFYLRPRILARYVKEVVACGNVVPFVRKAILYLFMR